MIPLPPHPPPLVGRERESALLREALAAALGGRGGLVLIGGEAGIGKTALAEAVCREADEQGALALVGRCYDLTETPPYGPWIELFGHYRRDNGMPPPPIAFADRGSVDAAPSQAVLFRQVLDFLATLAERRPLVSLLDDLHWADPASLDLLRFVARSAATLPLLILATYRADELTRRHPLYALLPVLVREAHAARIDLLPFERGDVGALVAARYPLSDGDAGRLVAYLQARSEGNPFFLGELLRTLEAERALRQLPDGWALGDLGQAQIPPLLRQVIDGRLARLDGEAQRLLAVAAVIGQVVPLAHWMAAAGAAEEALGRAIERAAAARILEPSPDGDGVRFAHALIREALYEGVAPLLRRGWHRRVGEHLADLPAPDPDAVAYHFRRAGDARAAPWLVRAGDRAERAYAWATAAERLEAALTLLDGGEADAGARGWLCVRLAWLRHYTDPAQGIGYLEAAERLAAIADDRALQALTRYARGLLYCHTGSIRRGLAEMEEGVVALEG
ncbi:MAG TPA: AAA family ATPase, partial [Thermomicrobiales bacterium]